MAAKKREKTEAKKPDPNRSNVVRLRKGTAAKLEVISETYGTSQGQLVDWAIEALLKKIEANGGKLTLPITFVPEPVEGVSYRGVSLANEDPGQYDQK